MWIYVLYAILAAVAAVFGYKFIKLSWDALRQKVSGKRIAVLGEHAVGKTNLIKFLTMGTFSSEYVETAEPTVEKGRAFQLSELKLKIDDIIDFSGGEEWYSLWYQRFKGADIVFYLFKANEYFKGNKKTQDRVHQDLGQIDLWLREDRDHKPMCFLVGTHCDLIPSYNDIPAENNRRAKFSDDLIKSPAARELKLHVDASRIKLGSTKTPGSTGELVYRLFHQIQITE